MRIQKLEIIIATAAVLLLLSCHSDVPSLPNFDDAAVQKYCGFTKETQSLCRNLYSNNIDEETCKNVLEGKVFNNDKCVDVSSSSSSDDGSSSSSDDGSSSSNEGSSSSSDEPSSSSNGL
jgi:hypothetical protein